MSQSEYRGSWIGSEVSPSLVRDRLLRCATRINVWFCLVVVLPSTLAALYFFVIASNIYMSEARFLVHSEDRSVSSPIGALLQGAGATPVSNETFAVQSFITSRAAVRNLQRSAHLRDVLGRPDADFLTRFPNPIMGDSFEALYWHYQRFVDVTVDNTTGVTTLQVKAFRPEDARAIAEALLQDSEKLVNSLNARAQADAVAEAMHEVDGAERNLADIEVQLTRYRSDAKILDPKLSSTVLYSAVGTLLNTQAAVATQLADLQKSSPNSPTIPTLKARLAALNSQLDQATLKAAGGAQSLADKLGGYERLSLQQDLAAKILATATDALETARIDAQRKHIYIEHIADPGLPDYPLYPKRLFSFVIVLVSFLLIYGVAWLLLEGVREHGSA